MHPQNTRARSPANRPPPPLTPSPLPSPPTPSKTHRPGTTLTCVVGAASALHLQNARLSCIRLEAAAGEQAVTTAIRSHQWSLLMGDETLSCTGLHLSCIRQSNLDLKLQQESRQSQRCINVTYEPCCMEQRRGHGQGCACAASDLKLQHRGGGGEVHEVLTLSMPFQTVPLHRVHQAHRAIPCPFTPLPPPAQSSSSSAISTLSSPSIHSCPTHPVPPVHT